MIRRIFLDMDGTLLNSQGKVTPTNAKLIRDANIPITLVSARAPLEMAAAIQALHLTGPQIGFNGGLIYQPSPTGWTVLQEKLLPEASAITLIEAIAKHFPAVSLSFYDRDRWYAPHQDKGVQYEESITNRRAIHLPLTQISRVQAHLFKLMMITTDEAEMAQLIDYTQRLQVPGVAIQRSGSAYLEITSKEAKKSYGIQYLLTRFALSPKETAAFGDGHNDLPMLKLVGTPIAVANAQPAVTKVAKFTTTSNDDDGVGKGIHKYLLP